MVVDSVRRGGKKKRTRRGLRTADSVLVLVEESGGLVAHILSIMLNDEGLVGKAGFGEERVVLQGDIDLVNEPFVGSFWHAALLIKETKQPHLRLDQINARLVVLVVNE